MDEVPLYWLQPIAVRARRAYGSFTCGLLNESFRSPSVEGRVKKTTTFGEGVCCEHARPRTCAERVLDGSASGEKGFKGVN